jgi:hypothetical protein
MSQTTRRIDEILNDDEAAQALGIRDEASIERDGVIYPVGSVSWNREELKSVLNHRNDELATARLGASSKLGKSTQKNHKKIDSVIVSVKNHLASPQQPNKVYQSLNKNSLNNSKFYK